MPPPAALSPGLLQLPRRHRTVEQTREGDHKRISVLSAECFLLWGARGFLSTVGLAFVCGPLGVGVLFGAGSLACGSEMCARARCAPVVEERQSFIQLSQDTVLVLSSHSLISLSSLVLPLGDAFRC